MFFKTLYIVFNMNLPGNFKKVTLAFLIMFLNSCASIESTVDSTLDSISEAGDYLYDSVNFWEDDEPEQSEAVVIEQAVEVPEYALPDSSYFEGNQQQDFNQQQSSQMSAQPPYYDPIYRSARQYYFVGPNGTPMLAPPPPPFPQYSIDQAAPVPYSYSNNLGIPQNNSNIPMRQNFQSQQEVENFSPVMTLEEEMELFGMQNDCVRVKKDYVNGGFMCDDYE
jgi:hypothetical protein